MSNTDSQGSQLRENFLWTLLAFEGRHGLMAAAAAVTRQVGLPVTKI
jgi:hypothetical protein